MITFSYQSLGKQTLIISAGTPLTFVGWRAKVEKPIALFSHLGLSPHGKEPWEHAMDPTPQSTHPGKAPVNLCGWLGAC